MLNQPDDVYELSPIQAGMLFHALTRPGSGVDIEQVVAHMEEPVDLDALIAGWRYATQRHPVLRTAFRWQDCPQPVQEVWAQFEPPIAKLDWSDLGSAEEDSRLIDFLYSDRHQGFDLGQAPPIRLTFIRLGPRTIMVWTFHHILLDGRSFPLLLREVFSYGEHRCSLQPFERSPPPPFRRHIEWLRARDHGASKSYWQHRLAGFRAPVRLWLECTNGNSVDGEDKGEFGHVEVHSSPAATSAMQRAAAAAGVTMNTLLQGAWAVLLSRLSGERDVVFGATRACRRSGLDGADKMIGILINTLPVRIDADPAAEVVRWLNAIRSQSLSMRAHEHTPLASVQGWSDVQRGQPLFESIVVYEHLTLDAQVKALSGDWQRLTFQYIGQTNFPLALMAYGGERLLLRVEYARARFDGTAAERVLRYLETLLLDMAERILDPRLPSRLADVRLLPANERAKLIASGRPEPKPVACLPLHRLFERQARERADRPAVVAGEERLTYAQLNARANRVAHALRQNGIGRNDIVGLAVERSADVAVGILAILKAGAAYLPLDPDYPRDRLAFVIDDARVRVVLASSTLAGSLQLEAAQYLDIATAGTGHSDIDPDTPSTPHDLAYVIYTSGSTGKPKGVLVTHANVSRLFTATEPWFAFGPHDTWTLFHSYAFDFSVWELWGALLYGGRVVVVPYWVSRDPAAFRKLLVDERVTILNQTPSAFRQLVQADGAEAPATYALREIIFGGEALELQALKPWMLRYGDAKPRLVNMYGITETTVHVTYRPITRADVEAGRGSVIGIPIPDLYLRLLDARGEPVPVGVPGEIWVGGAGVARGYLNRPELTTQRFVTDPFDPSGTARLYRAGDLARRLPDGELEFLGRIDAQVKIRGFRIELGEIEAALAAIPDIADAAVIAREDTPGDKRLVAYIVGKDDRQGDPEHIRAQLAAVLPAHMIPAHFIALPKLPLNANGKLDHTKLPKPETAGRSNASLDRSFVPPRSETERKIAAAWATVLRLERVGADDNFFLLGGDSILSIQVAANCRRAGVLGITTRDLFEHPTVAALARCVDGREQREEIVTAARPTGMVALTPIQRWFFEHEFSEVNHWNQAFLFQAPDDLDSELLGQALTAVCEHHDAFRLCFRKDGGTWLTQLVDSVHAITVVRHDLSSLPPDAWASEIEQRCAAEQATLDIAKGRLLRAALFHLGSGQPGRLLLVAHHLAIDGISWRILLEDIETAYDCLRGGRAIELPLQTTAFQAWAAHLANYAGGAIVAATAPAWQAMLAAPAAQLSVFSSDSLEAAACTISAELASDETAALLQDVPAAYRTQINDVLVTALALALQRSTGGTSFLIELEGHGREDIDGDLDLSRTVGWFTSLFPLRLDLAADAGTEEALKSIKEQLRQVPDRGLTYGLLRYGAADSAQRAKLAYDRKPQLLFNYLGQLDQVTRGSKLFAFAAEATGPWHAPSGRRTHALEVLAQIRDGKLRADWIFSDRQMARTGIARLAADFIAALRAIIAQCRKSDAGGRTPSDVPLAALSQAEVDQLWQRYRGFAEAYPLTPMQRLFHVMEQAGSSIGLEQWQFRIEGRLEPHLLRAAFDQVITRHSILRTAFATVGSGEPVQVVMPGAAMPWRELDWRHLGARARQAALHQELAQDARTKLDLSQPPLMRVSLLRVDEAEWQLLWTTHHLCIDGWSWPLLFMEIAEIYAALQERRPAALESAVGYGDYVGWLVRNVPASSAYWKEALAGFAAPTPIALGPVTAAVPGAHSSNLQSEIMTCLPAGLTRDLRLLAQSTGITLSTLVQAAWALLLAHYAESRDVVFGTTFSGRPEQVEGIETLIGPCVTNVPVRTKLAPEESLPAWLAGLQAQQLDLNQHQFTPLDAIQGLSEIPWHQRLFDSLIVFQNYQVDAALGQLGRDARLIPVQAPEATNYALTIAVSPGEELSLRLIYTASRIDPGTVAAIASDLPELLAALGASGPTSTIADILAKMPAERRSKAAAAARTARALRTRTTSTSAPKSETEHRLVEIWSELLGRTDIGVDDNFFDAGGQSLLLLRMHRLVEDAFGVRLQIVRLLEHPTIRTLAGRLNVSTGPQEASRHAELAADRASKQRAAMAKQRMKGKLG